MSPPSGSGSSLTSESIDLVSTEPQPVVEEPRGTPQRDIYNPDRDREIVRGKIALYLLYMLAGVLLLAFISMWWGIKEDVLRTVLTIIVGPLVTLVSAATGFYYGTRSS